MDKELKDLTTEELVDLMNESVEDTSEIVTSDATIQKFIRELMIVPGEVKVPTYLIYHVYKRIWSNQGKKTSKIGFFREFNKHFDQVRTGKVRYYLLGEGSFDLSEESLAAAKKHDKRYTKERKKK